MPRRRWEPVGEVDARSHHGILPLAAAAPRPPTSSSDLGERLDLRPQQRGATCASLGGAYAKATGRGDLSRSPAAPTGGQSLTRGRSDRATSASGPQRVPSVTLGGPSVNTSHVDIQGLRSTEDGGAERSLHGRAAVVRDPQEPDSKWLFIAAGPTTIVLGGSYGGFSAAPSEHHGGRIRSGSRAVYASRAALTLDGLTVHDVSDRGQRLRGNRRGRQA